MKRLSALLCSALLCSAVYASDAWVPKEEEYPHLNSTADGSPARCHLKPEEAEWLETQMEEGKIRLAKPEDIRAWEDLAKEKKRPVQNTLDCGRTYVIAKKLEIPKNTLSNHYIVFIIPADVEPPIPNSMAAFYDMKTGGWLQGGVCDDGEKRGIGKSTRECKGSL